MVTFREAAADHSRKLLAFTGFTLVTVSSSFEVPVLSAVGLVTLFAAWFLHGFVSDLLASDGDSVVDPVEELRERYASGELDHEEFERRVERLLATEDRPEDVEQVLDAERE